MFSQALPDPYRELADAWPDVRVRIRSDLGSDAGRTVWLPSGPEIHLAHDLTRVERRCTLAHEIMHLRRGAPPRPYDTDDEAATVKATAHWLIPDLAVFGAMLAATDVNSAAEQFNVIPAVVYERLDYLTRYEMDHLTAVLQTAAA